MLGGQPGWPTPEWITAYRPILNPYHLHADNLDAIHGKVSARDFVSFRTESQITVHKLSRTTTTTLYFNGAAVGGIRADLPPVELLAAQGQWRPYFDGKSREGDRFATGDPEFDRDFVLLAAPADQVTARSMLSSEAKAALNLLSRIAGAPRIRIAQGLVLCWVPGMTDLRAQHEAYADLLKALAMVATGINLTTGYPTR
ncbi:hypothetical protein D7D52_34170 [Nocardia yunnanensis]|uniref:Uncharacterized protein n=2 Tax=Nocardia yunnanensis TaxID=2382165 RepID=A0A386ZLK0_9NOCA|nr:hypothetical protein D7D52_34170 [Nocardia yunnanensis]